MQPLELAVWFILLILGSLAAVGGVNRFWPGLLQSEFPDKLARAGRERELKKEVEDLKTTVAVLSKELKEAHQEIAGLNNELGQLRKEVESLRANTPKPAKRKSKRVVGVWPTAPQLDQKGEAAGVYNAGFEYVPLWGPNASRAGVVRELARQSAQDYDEVIVEIGAKGGAAGIQLEDGLAAPGWWSRLARQYSLNTFVVLANESSKPDVLSVADALFSAGVRYVISVDASISDADAVQFARMFYERLAAGSSVSNAVQFAKLVITDGAAETIRLRER